MTMTFYFFLSYYLLLLFFLLLLNILQNVLKKDNKADTFQKEKPFISILIAARNEESNILSCLQAVAGLSWPAEKLEVLVGDDQSSDKTGELVKNFIKDKPNFKIFRIEKNLGKARGKANVLAHLAREAKGSFFFITDADVRVPSSWIQSLLANCEGKQVIVSGATYMEANSLFGYCQSIDWVYGFNMIKVASDCGIPVSSAGNNMMISAQAYFDTGGYENIPFSVTEDHALFIAALKEGWDYKNTMNQDCLALTNPMSSPAKLLKQRKRWMQGAVKVPFVLVLFLLLQAVFLPVAIAGLFHFPVLTLAAWGFKLLLQQLFLFFSFRQIRRPYQIWKGALLYELYSGILSPLVLLYYLIPMKVEWKGRRY